MIGYHCLQKVVLSLRPDAVPNFTKEEEQDLFEARDLLLDNGLQQLLGKIVVNHPDWLSSLSLEQRAPLDALQNPQQPSEAEEKRSLSALEEIQLFIRLSGSVYDKTKYANEQELATNLVRLFGNLNNVVLYLQRSSNGQKNFKARVVFKLPSSEEWQPDLWRIFLLSRTDSCWAAQFINQIGMIEANLDGTELKKLTQDDVLKAVARVKYGREKADRNMELALLCYCYDVNQKAFMIALNTELKSHDILPDIAIDGRDLGYPGFYFVKMQPGDLRGFVLGEMTACCQSVGGYGQWCALHGMTSENGGFYILCKGGLENKSPKDKIVAQTWAWLSKAGSLVCDSWEGFKDNCGGEEGYAAICADFLSAAACEVGRRNYTGLRLGTDGQTPPKGLPFKAPKADIPLDHQGCPDSAEQYLIVPSAYYIARLEDLYADRINIIMVVVHYAKLVAEYSADKKQDVARYKEILCKIDDDSDLKEKLNPAGQMVLERAIAGEGDKSENEALVYLTKDAYREIEEAFSGKMDNYLDNFEFHEGIGKGLEKFKQVCVQALKYSSTALALLYDSRLRKLLDDVRIEKIAKRYNLYLNSCKREVFLLAHDEVAIALIKKPDLRADVNGRCPVAIEVFAQAALKEGSVRVAQALYEDTNLWGMATNESKRNISLTHAEIFLQMLQDKREDFSNHYFSDIVAFYALAQGEIRAQILKYVAGNADLVKRLNYAAKLLLFNAISQFNGVNVAGDISVEYKRQCSRGFFVAEGELDALGYLAREAYDVMQENVRKNDLSLGDVYSSSRKDSIIEKFSPIYCYAEEHASAALSLLYDANLSSLLDASELRDSFSRKELGMLHEEVALEFIANSALRSGGRVNKSVVAGDFVKMAMVKGRDVRVAQALYDNAELWGGVKNRNKWNISLTHAEIFLQMLQDKREDFSNHYFSDIVAFYALAQGEIRAQILKYVAGNADLVKRLNYAAKLLLFNAISQFNGVNVAGDISVEYKRQCSRGFFVAEGELDALGYLAREAYDVMQENVRKNDLSLGDVYSSSRKDSIIEKFSPIYCYAEEHASAALSLLYDANLSSLLDASELRDSFSRKELGVLHEEVALEFIANSALRSGGRVARSICISDLHEMAISEGRSDRVAMALYADQTLFEQLTVQQKMNLATRFEAFRGAIIDDGSFQEIFNSFTRKQQWELIQNSCCKVIARLQETGGLFQWLRKMQSAELSWLRKNNFVFVLTALWKNEKLLEWVLTLSVGHINDCVEGFVAAIEEEADGIQKSMLMELYRSQKLIGKLYVCVVDSMQNKLFSVAKADADIAFQCGEVALMRENKTGARSFFLSAFAQGYDRDEVYTKLLACDDDLFEAAEAIYGSETFSEFQDRAETDVDAMLICGNCRLFGAGGVVKDLSEALKYFYAAQAGGLSTVAWDLDAAHFTLLDDVITPLTRSRKGICFFSRFDANGVGLNPCRVALTALHEKKKALRSSNGGSPYEQLSQEVKRQIAVLKEVEGDHKICAKNLAATLTLALSTKGLPVASETENSADIPRFGP